MSNLKIGIDPSINSTGICIRREGGHPLYFIITSKMTKKMKDFEHRDRKSVV